MKIICDYCGKEFNKTPSRFNRTKNHYCSYYCHNEHRKNNPTLKKGNLYIIEKDYSIMIIESKKYGKIEVYIDTEDIAKCNKYTWYARYSSKLKNFYIGAPVYGSKNIILHRFLKDCPIEFEIDHINRNTLDNRKCNLRVCTRFINMQNLSTNKSGYVGVWFDKSRKSYQVRINVNNKQINLGRFKDINDAIKARKEAELKYYNS